MCVWSDLYVFVAAFRVCVARSKNIVTSPYVNANEKSIYAQLIHEHQSENQNLFKHRNYIQKHWDKISYFLDASFEVNSRYNNYRLNQY